MSGCQIRREVVLRSAFSQLNRRGMAPSPYIWDSS
jgi:hypothetical protein